MNYSDSGAGMIQIWPKYLVSVNAKADAGRIPDFTITDFTKVFQSIKTEAKWLELISHSQRRTKEDPKTIILVKMEPGIKR